MKYPQLAEGCFLSVKKKEIDTLVKLMYVLDKEWTTGIAVVKVECLN